ncbi:alpha-N-acetylglucosaminidase [Bacteroidia bacterium]|nr:alpha-N-acetylglucosaminidase [Bacteroidia bacterium]
MKRSSLFLIFLLTASGISLKAAPSAQARQASPGETAARGVIERTLGYSPANIRIEIAGRDAGGSDWFSTSVEKNILTVKGSTPVAVCHGFYDYVKSNGYGMVTWSDNNIKLPKKLPNQSPKKVVSPFRHRYYMNVCTLGYTTPYWQWDRWEKELDWMALHGFDMPLSPIGSEAIFARVWRQLGLTESEIDDFVTGPAHLPWFRMGNMSALDAPLSQKWYDQTIELEHKMVDRMNLLDMSPIYNAFAGFVPEAVKRIRPEVNLITTGWGGYFKCHFILPETDLYQYISKLYIQEWEKEFGKAKYYLADSFNEMEIPFAAKGTKERFDQISSYSRSVYKSIAAVNPDAVWVIQGWMLGFQRSIWDPESIEALLSGAPDDKMMVLDLSVDFNNDIWRNEYTWNYAPKFYGKQWVFSTVPNFGGRSCPIGKLEFYANGHLMALESPNRGNLVGFGTAPEGVENNDVVYEIISDAAWSSAKIDIRQWLKHYSTLRYGSCPVEIEVFWDKMLGTSYGKCTNRAQYKTQLRPFSIGGRKYDVSPEHFQAIESFMAAADKLSGNKLYMTDLAMWSGLYAFGKADVLTDQIHRCYITGDRAKAAGYEKEFMRLMRTADRFFESHPDMRMERWIDYARAFGRTPEESDRYETNARRLVTVWGPGNGDASLNDYACRIWSGLIRDYYIPRWEHYFAAKKSGTAFDFDHWEYKYAEQQRGVSPVKPYSDIVGESRALVGSSSEINLLMEGQSAQELGGWSPMELKKDEMRLTFQLNSEDFFSNKGVRIRHMNGKDPIEIIKVQFWADHKSKGLVEPNATLSGDNSVLEFPIEIPFEERRQGEAFLFLTVKAPKAGADSYALVELIR